MRVFIQGKRGREKRGRSEFKLRISPDRGSGDDRRLEERKLSERGSSLLGLGALYVRVGYIVLFYYGNGKTIRNQEQAAWEGKVRI